MKDSYQNRIKELREEKGLSQIELSKITSITQSNISRWEKGLHIPNMLDCCTLADYFDVDLDYLVGRKN